MKQDGILVFGLLFCREEKIRISQMSIFVRSRKNKEIYPDCAVTLSIGEKSEESYQAYFNAGADRYLLRHETADEDHYKKLHPEQMSLASEKIV